MSEEKYIPQSKLAQWFDSRLPLLTLSHHLKSYPKKFLQRTKKIFVLHIFLTLLDIWDFWKLLKMKIMILRR